MKSNELKSSVVTLKEEAKAANLFMINKLKGYSDDIRINHSTLASFIIQEFKEKHFEKCKDKMIETFRDSKKEIKNKLHILSEEELIAVTKYLNKMEKAKLASGENKEDI